ncbi:uncharacterized protein LOC110455106 [Mizuhopecten yessoensis]|uniref:uncharacterized protein LOC110455106 n=1 Tax=Mizuhopecten yessoensis TaxID=6573 RepID=UPI000B45C3FF|nr:uncharacterized protein LOC110455106 [Mizuhopecten yessoensis]
MNMINKTLLICLLVVVLKVSPLSSSKSAAIHSEVNDIWTKYGEVKAGLDALQTQVTPRKTQIQNIEMSMSGLEQSISSIQQDISRLKASVRRIKRKSSTLG